MTDERLKVLKHELRTPINHIIGYSELMLEGAAEDGLDDLVVVASEMRDQGRSLALLIDRYLLTPAGGIGSEQMYGLRDEVVTLLSRMSSDRTQHAQRAAWAQYSGDLAKIYAAIRHLQEAMETAAATSPA